MEQKKMISNEVLIYTGGLQIHHIGSWCQGRRYIWLFCICTRLRIRIWDEQACLHLSLSAHKREMLPEQKEVWATMKILKMHPATYFLLSQLNWVCAVKYALGLQNTLVQNTHPVCRRVLHCLVINQSSPPWIQIHSLCATIYFDLQHSTVLGAQVEATNDEFQEWWRGWLGHWPG